MVDNRSEFYGCDSFSGELSELATSAYNKLNAGVPLSGVSLLDLAVVSMVCNRVFRQNTSNQQAASPIFRVKGVIKHMNALVMDLQDIVDDAHKNYTSKHNYSSAASDEHLFSCSSVLIRMLYLSMENLTKIVNEIPGKPYLVTKMMALDMETSRREKNFSVRHKPQKGSNNDHE